MCNWHQRSAGAVLHVLLWTSIFSLQSFSAAAQDQRQSSPPLTTIVKQVVLDPTTYAPAAIAYDATIRDWNSSQPFFRNGFMELNPRFTVSGLPNDVPVSYSEGKRRILSDAVGNLGLSLVNNFTERALERTLMTRYPEHRKMVRAAGWVERISFGAGMAYVMSIQHFRQAESNAALAQELGYH
jgi:hypothetical protein